VIKVRRATSEDADEMAALLNQIISAGGTTAIETAVSGNALREWMQTEPDRSTWHVAVGTGGDIQGFQWAEPNPDQPTEAASFVRPGKTGQGVGGLLFKATQTACRTLGYTWINAAIRSDNTSGLGYYARIGFVDWKTDPKKAISDGTVTGKTYKRYDL
jgi:L-amino acid N-acyltransferase YncA